MAKYTHDTITHNTRAAQIVIPYVIDLINPKSALDVGCGIGTWTKILQEEQIEAIGIDYFDLDRNLLVISEDDFIPVDLEKGFDLNKRFDLIVCLEVLEHLRENSSETIIEAITRHSDTVLFSAAIPNQGGDNHINEQPFSFWFDKFEKRGYYFYDVFRDKYWQDERIEWWYRQNMFLVSNQILPLNRVAKINTYIHPNLFEKRNRELELFYSGQFPVSTGLKFLLKTIRSLIRSK